MIEHLLAHGFDPGPSQRPRTAGFIAAGACAPIGLFVFARSGLFSSAAMVALAAIVLVFEGVLYGHVFRRAANDRRGGWMFGMAFGFATWTAAIVVLRAARVHLLGLPAMGFFGGFVLHGAIVGLVFPWVHAVVKRRRPRASRGARVAR